MDINFTDDIDDAVFDDKDEFVGDSKAKLDNKELIQKLNAKRVYYEDKILKINAVIELLKQTPNFSKTYEFLQATLG